MPSFPPPSIRIARRWQLVSALAAIALVAALGAIIVFREGNKPFGVEAQWMKEIVENRFPFGDTIALLFNSLGGGILSIAIIPASIIVILLLWRRRWAALYFAIAASASGALVQLIKALVGRPRPVDILVHVDFGSFPSGHSANAALIATTLGIILHRRWVWAVGAFYTIAMMLSRTYLGAHWISDTVGGLFVGVGVAIIVWAPLAYRLYREKRMPHPPPWRSRDIPSSTSTSTSASASAESAQSESAQAATGSEESTR